MTAHLFVAVVEDEHDGGSEDYGHQTDTQTEYPEFRCAVFKVHVNGRVHSTPQHQIQKLQQTHNKKNSPVFPLSHLILQIPA